MSQELPQHILEELRAQLAEGKSAKEIAFMMRLDEGFVSNEIARANTPARHIEILK